MARISWAGTWSTAALERGHEVATFTRGVSGPRRTGCGLCAATATTPGALTAALDGWLPELVVDTSCQTRAAADNAAAALADVAGYAFVSSLNAYRSWPPGPIGPEDDEPTWDTAGRRLRPGQGATRNGPSARRSATASSPPAPD